MYDTRDAVRLAHHRNTWTAIRLERDVDILFLACLVAAALVFPYLSPS
jgi:hypothetical protein